MAERIALYFYLSVMHLGCRNSSLPRDVVLCEGLWKKKNIITMVNMTDK